MPRVLLVEDEVLIRMMMGEILRDEGFEVIEAWSGDEAVKLLASCGPLEALFTDVRMPGDVDGIDLAHHVRLSHPGLPVLVVSGYAVNLTERLGGLKPPVKFLDKPYDFAMVVVALNGMISTQQSDRPKPPIVR